MIEIHSLSKAVVMEYKHRISNANRFCLVCADKKVYWFHHFKYIITFLYNHRVDFWDMLILFAVLSQDTVQCITFLQRTWLYLYKQGYFPPIRPAKMCPYIQGNQIVLKNA